MAQLGSCFATALNWFSADSYSNECSSATPRSNDFCTPAAQDVGKATLPSFSPGIRCEWPSSASKEKEEQTIDKKRHKKRNFIKTPDDLEDYSHTMRVNRVGRTYSNPHPWKKPWPWPVLPRWPISAPEDWRFLIAGSAQAALLI